MDTLPRKPNLVVNGEMPEIIAKKVLILPLLFFALQSNADPLSASMVSRCKQWTPEL